jgi:hypothetical protein
LKFDHELLYVAALFHDLGLVDHSSREATTSSLAKIDADDAELGLGTRNSQNSRWFAVCLEEAAPRRAAHHRLVASPTRARA